MANRCCFDFETSPEIIEYGYEDFQTHLTEKCAPGLFAAVQKARAQAELVDAGATRDVGVDIDVKCKIDDDFIPDCDGTITIKV